MRRILLSVMSVGITGVFLGAATLAVFTASASSVNNVFTTGTMNITTNGSTGFITMSNMKPGDSVSRTLNVTNPGTLNETFNVTSNATDNVTGNLTSWLSLTINDTSGVLYSGPINGTSNVVTLNNGITDTLNFTVTLNSSANSTVQDTSANTTFTFNATQL